MKLLHGSILQAGTCQTPSLDENPRWSRVWQYAQKDLWKWEENDKSQKTKSCQDDWIFFNLGLLSSPATSAQGWSIFFLRAVKVFLHHTAYPILVALHWLSYAFYLMLIMRYLLLDACHLIFLATKPTYTNQNLTGSHWVSSFYFCWYLQTSDWNTYFTKCTSFLSRSSYWFSKQEM